MSLLPSRPDTSAAEAEAEPRVIGVDSDDADDVISALSSDTARQLLAELHEEPAPPSKLAERADTSLQNAQYHLEKLQSAGAVSVVDTAYSAKGREMDVYAPADQPLVIFAGNEDETTGLRAALSRLLGGLGILGIGSLAVQRLYGDVGTAPGEGSAVPGGNETATLDGATGATPSGETDVNLVPEQTPDGSTAETVNGSVSTFEGSGTEVSYNLTGTIDNETLASALDNGTLYFTDADGTRYVVEATNATTSGATDSVTTTATEATTTVAQTTTAAPEMTGAAADIDPGLLFFAGGAVVLALWLLVWYLR